LALGAYTSLTAAEWEHAARGGSIGDGDNQNVFEADYMYTVTVTANADGLVVGFPTKGQKVTL
jgi:formylglycine-generating enzyme required for sulfatase activity